MSEMNFTIPQKIIEIIAAPVFFLTWSPSLMANLWSSGKCQWLEVLQATLWWHGGN